MKREKYVNNKSLFVAYISKVGKFSLIAHSLYFASLFLHHFVSVLVKNNLVVVHLIVFVLVASLARVVVLVRVVLGHGVLGLFDFH